MVLTCRLNRLIVCALQFLMMILLVLLVLEMNLKMSMLNVFVFGSMKNVKDVLRKNKNDSLKMIIKKQKKQKSVTLQDRVDFLLRIARINSFAKTVYTRRDLHLSPCVLPQTLEQQFEYVFNKLFAL